MPIIIKSLNDLSKILEPRIIKALEFTRDEIFEVVAQKVYDYYNEPVFSPPNKKEPNCYIRTYELMTSLTGSHVTKANNGYEFTVGWDDEYLAFRYPGGFGPNDKYNKVTGLEVLNWYTAKSHGGTVPGKHRYFDEAINELGGTTGIIEKFKANLQKYGVPIK